ncbi:unnamed protein product, partial [Mesorhabditis belari]|uniref:Protein kinase domain-containing protein n=1 Tax=Mesorhabditis belari TaxID=2138241 RepID=A0AAF3F723_9BILA
MSRSSTNRKRKAIIEKSIDNFGDDGEKTFVGHGGFGDREAFKKECATLEKLRHPNIVAYIRSRNVSDGGQQMLAIVMEFCEKGSLRQVLFDAKIIYSMRTVLTWSKQLFSVLTYLKQNDVIHRDIKPDNILVTKNFLLKVGDFGSIKLKADSCSGTFVGTLRYMSPPRAGEPVGRKDHFMSSHRNDVYSLGLVLWEIVEQR